MNKWQFSALFFAITLCQDGLNQYIHTLFVVCATIAFLAGMKGD